MLACYLKPEERFGLNEVYKFGIVNIVKKRIHIILQRRFQRQSVGRTNDADVIIYDLFLCILVYFGIVLTQKQDKYKIICNTISGQMGQNQGLIYSRFLNRKQIKPILAFTLHQNNYNQIITSQTIGYLTFNNFLKFIIGVYSTNV